jgi:type VI secretion system protein ImpH
MGTESRIEAARVTRLEPPAESRSEVIERLFQEPFGFGFFQAVQLLERHFASRAPVGGFGDPGAEAVRFRTNPSVAFPPSEIESLEQPRFDANRAGADYLATAMAEALERPVEMTVNFFGLTGPQGVLPLPYALYLAERERFGDGAMRAFLDIFNHRALSLLYRAWEQRHATAVLGQGDRDWLTRHVLDLLGLGLPSVRKQIPLPHEALVFYSGLLGMPSRPALALEQLLADYFDVAVEVEQFVGAWYRLEAATQCELGDANESSLLGEGAVVGDEVWDQQSRIRVRIGPLTRARYVEFLPGGAAHESQRAQVRLFTGDEIDFELQLVLARSEVPSCVLGADPASAPPLGWCTWLRTTPLARDPDETILTL